MPQTTKKNITSVMTRWFQEMTLWELVKELKTFQWEVTEIKPADRNGFWLLTGLTAEKNVFKARVDSRIPSECKVVTAFSYIKG